ncbi:MAG: hypothetical protein GY760_15680 [Deltaproteobacteria bacterium]|nr:hypothetical protein [Deltaproteobacteria bacterium]
MKSIFLIAILLPIFCMASVDSVKSLLGIPFGDICTIKAIVIDKPNTYYAQNISPAEYYLKILEINDRELAEPLIVEPLYKDLKLEVNKTYTFKAYETIYSENVPVGWEDQTIAQQANYWIIQKIVIKKT